MHNRYIRLIRYYDIGTNISNRHKRSRSYPVATVFKLPVMLRQFCSSVAAFGSTFLSSPGWLPLLTRHTHGQWTCKRSTGTTDPGGKPNTRSGEPRKTRSMPPRHNHFDYLRVRVATTTTLPFFLSN
jgi:hypothetical protein